MDDQTEPSPIAPVSPDAKKARRSRTGCLYCRRRKIKCDEQLPTCGHCLKTGRQCDSTTTLFRQHRPSVSHRKSVDPGRGRIFSPQTTSTSEDNTWAPPVPRRVEPVIEDGQEKLPSIERVSSLEMPSPASSMLPDASHVATPRSLDLSRHSQDMTVRGFPLKDHGLPTHTFEAPALTVFEPSSFQQPQSTSPLASRLQDTPLQVSQAHAQTSPSIISHSYSGSTPANLSHVQSPPLPETSPSTARRGRASSMADRDESVEITVEDAFFLRHFSETPGRWMDLFDLDCFYSLQAPILARRNLLVRYAACAFAAKQLGRVGGRKTVRGGVARRLADMEIWGEQFNADYTWYAMKYYDKAISLLMEDIAESNHAHRDDYNRRYNDETIAAATILCNYEFMSSTTAGWSKHLDGTQSLLRLKSEEGLFQFEPSPRFPPVVPQPPKALRAAFWNFARQDFLASLITRRPTRLNTTDLDMWRAMGIAIDTDGLITPSNTEPPAMREDGISNALVWLLSKIANFIAGGGGDWHTLDHELSVWHDGLPRSFEPSARIPLSASPIRHETWFPNSMCASTVQSYHMARILLLINRPATGDLLAAYRALHTELERHAREICAAGLGRPEDGARVHSLQPLYIAGRCLADPAAREVLLGLMRDVEADLGWAAEYRVEELMREWAGNT